MAKENDSTNFVISDSTLDEFKRVYSGSRGGKYNLEVQVPYLKMLAEGYQERFSQSRNWTDCLKSHALWNSVSVRCPEEQQWSQKAYTLQKMFWEESEKTSFEQQNQVATQVKSELKNIRNQTREDLKTAEFITQEVSSKTENTLARKSFCTVVEKVAVDCTDAMLKLTEYIFQKSVEALKEAPPCEFCVVIIGSMAKEEATPYSDLEYIFLIEKRDAGTERWFEKLAVTSYFLIGNLQETKLKYMNIAELTGWFDDQQQNGFKIDGLAEVAGNIPTGNGSTNEKNHFILTPRELLKTYQKVSNNPVNEEGTRADLTAMVQYTKVVFSNETTPGTLLLSFKSKKEVLKVNAAREAANLKMFESDAKYYDFRPDQSLINECYKVDSKRQLYRYPSILLFNISILTQFCKNNSWSTLKGLLDTGKISCTLYDSLSFLLACACYFRLSAYLHHDSQDERLSVLPATEIANLSSIPSGSPQARRWFLPQELFNLHCEHAILVKDHIKKSPTKSILDHLKMELAELGWVMKFYILYCCNRWKMATKFFYENVSESVVKEQPEKTMKLMSQEVDGDLKELWKLVNGLSYCLLQYREFESALNYTSSFRSKVEVILNREIGDKTNYELLLADVLDEMGRCCNYLHKWEKAKQLFTDALKLREKHESSSSDKVALSYYNIANHEKLLMNLSNAEKWALQGLQIAYKSTLQVVEHDYYGHLVESQKAQEEIFAVDLTALSTKNRLRHINHFSHTVTHFTWNLGQTLFLLKRYEDGLCYGQKTLEILQEVYGVNACNQEMASASQNYACALDMVGQYQKADIYFHKAVVIYTRTCLEESEKLLEELNRARGEIGKDGFADGYYEVAVKTFLNIPGLNAFHFQTSEALRHYAFHLVHRKQHGLAEKVLQQCEQAVVKRARIDKNRLVEEALAHIKAVQALNSWKSGNHELANARYKQALELRKEEIPAVQMDAAEILQQKSMMYESLNKYQKAEHCLSQALELYQKSCDENHPKIKEVSEQLESVRVHLPGNNECEEPERPK
ncbi:uncharacterized protein [Watersipora subatra]|uniref:uncharacterized protein n=1 Tax=Watersipora subatra TaxID=2589382 RepID=UPI00355B67DF